MEKNARTLIVFAVLVAVASMVLCVSRMEQAHSGVKQGNVTTNTPQAIDGAVRKVMEEMPPITAFRAAFATVGDTVFTLPYDYGDTSRFVTIATQVSGTLTAYRVINETASSVHILRSGGAAAVVFSVVTYPRGTWGK